MRGMLPLIAFLLLSHAPQDELQRIDAKGIEETVKFLASDELLGRSTGTPENELAARYLAKRFEELGLKPAVGESYLQPVPMRLVGQERAAELDVYISVEDFGTHAAGIWFDPIGAAASTEKLTVLTVEGIEDLPLEADADVALFLSGSSRQGRKWLTERGHEGGAGWGAIISRGSKRNGRAWVKRDPRLVLVSPEEPSEESSTPWMRVHGETRTAFEDGRVHFIQLRTYPIEEEVPAHNVAGLIRGVGTKERPELAEEVVVLTAHFDHIGTAKPRKVDGEADSKEAEEVDLIYNGADDDASGVACVVELADAFANGPAPARTLLFLLVTGEEIGLLGTKHYLEAPLFPLEKTCCNLNYEMIGRADELAGGAGRLWLTGHERSNLMGAIEREGISISPDVRPEQNFFQRSDNYAFAVRGIVAQTFSTYNMHQDYHQVTDEWDTLDYEHMEVSSREAYRIARLVADGEIDPAWLEGGKPRGR
jgi:hypothetical protein